ncbi:hypothetical protein TNCV_3407111 [Trichonephila clavipes]|nr:hypothetical protein TNCV_3407111 [Trichonephila clavipes]
MAANNVHQFEPSNRRKILQAVYYGDPKSAAAIIGDYSPDRNSSCRSNVSRPQKACLILINITGNSSHSKTQHIGTPSSNKL